MFVDKDLSNSSSHGSEGSKSGGKLGKRPDSTQKNPPNPNDNIEVPDKGSGFHCKAEPDHSDEFQPAEPSKTGHTGSQELTLSYLCDNGKLGFSSGKNSPPNLKGKEVVSESSYQKETCVVRDFLQLNGGGSSKRDLEEEDEGDRDRENRDKKVRMEKTLNLSLALPDVSLSLTPSEAGAPSNAAAALPAGNENNFHHQSILRPSRSVQSLTTSNCNTQTTCSNDFTGASLSYSYSHPFSHNPSCSLTLNSTENYDCSMGSYNRRENDQIWNCGEGTNGSVHSRFRPAGDGGGGLSAHRGVLGQALMNSGRSLNREQSNSFYKAAGSDSTSFFPSELPARPPVATTAAGDSKGKSLDQFQVVDPSEDRTPFTPLSRQAKIVLQCVSESVPVMAQIFQELTDEAIDSARSYLQDLIQSSSEAKRELAALQCQLERRSDLTKETLSKSHRSQLEILVAVKFGLKDFISKESRSIPTTELIEIFLLIRCRNISCKSVLPVDECECKICSSKGGFCSQCMCPVCFNFDCANNTCSWVGCDVCSHWCHASCGIEKKLIRPGPSLKGLLGTTAMQFHCPGCGHFSEMLGFVKDVFMYCAKGWSLQTLIKELECVAKIFKGSEDVKGKALYLKAQEAIYRLERRAISATDACNSIFQFFNSASGGSGSVSELPAPTTMSSKDLMTLKSFSRSMKESSCHHPHTSSPNSLPQSSTFLRDSHLPITSSSTFNNHNNKKPSSRFTTTTAMTTTNDNTSNHKMEAANHILMSGGAANLVKSSGGGGSGSTSGHHLDSLESVVRIKEAEAMMFQTRADEARKEAEGYRQLVRVRSEKLDEEYANKLAKLCLQETEERRRKKVEELKVLENSHCEYYKMKMRMQAEIAGLLERMEATKQQWV